MGMGIGMGHRKKRKADRQLCPACALDVGVVRIDHL